jgi:hypothetical protein
MSTAPNFEKSAAPSTFTISSAWERRSTVPSRSWLGSPWIVIDSTSPESWTGFSSLAGSSGLGACCAIAGSSLPAAARINSRNDPSAVAKSERGPDGIDGGTLLARRGLRPDVLVRKPRRSRYASERRTQATAFELPFLHASVTQKSQILWWARIGFGDFGCPEAPRNPRR